ncbi:putative PDC1-pyruvate decarboxylase, isozyme 1 [Hymenopellis radicata]|nr:putative PDC1-pyruvate decarboxylase, isozyme 1 [Hymenopellis radicata]
MNEITIGNYLLERLKQLGVSTMFGVPGDFNLGFLDLVEDDPNMDWVGNCNELNAAYAADGYARVKRDSVGALLTTFGVGELSALNGIAGAYSEMIPVVHIVGVPSRSHLEAKPTLHHTLADGRFDVYAQAAKLFTASQAFLMQEETAASEIDRVLLDCINLRRPVYLAIPIDLVLPKISAEPLARPIERTVHVNPVDDENAVLEEVEKLVQGSAGDVIILVDVCSLRKGAEKETVDFIKKVGFSATIDEGYERYGGIYIGAFSRLETKEAVESAKLVLTIGYLITDFNTGLFTNKLLPSRVIQFHSTRTQIFDKEYPSVGMKGILPKLAERLQAYRPASVTVPRFNAVLPADESDVITQKWLWPRMSQFFKRGDVIVTETGTASFGILDVPFADDCTLVSQILFGSIAARETTGGRTILFIGDGSLQVGVQELSTMIGKGVHPTIFLLNNSGYTIERCVRSPQKKYHDIVNWRWTSLLQDLGDSELKSSKSFTVNTKAELSNLLNESEFAGASRIQLVEVMLDKFDAPDVLANIANAVGRAK